WRSAAMPATIPHAAARSPFPPNVLRLERAAESLQLDVADRRRVDHLLDRGVDALADHDLTGAGVRAQAGGEVRHRAERSVVVAPFESDPTEGGVAGLDADS